MRNGNSLKTSAVFEFGVFRLNDELSMGRETVKLPPKVLRCLTLLVEKNGKTVTKDEFFAEVWPDTFVEDNALSYTISQLRKSLAQYDKETKYIETVPRRGFRFVADVKAAARKQSDELILQRHRVEEVWFEETIDAESPRTATNYRPLKRTSRAWIAASAMLLTAVAGASIYLGSRASSTNSADSRSSFAANNKVLTDFGFKAEKARAVALQPDGKFVVGGWAGDVEGTSDFAVARYNPDGSLDPNFGGDGKVITAIGPLSDIIYAVALQPDGKILAAGVSFGGPENRRFCIARYKSDGALDAGFDGDGIITLNIGTTLRDTAYAIALQPDGKIIIAGSASRFIVTNNERFPSNDFGLLRLNPDGSPDATFGINGAVITNFGHGVDIAYSVALQADGKIIAAGNSTNGANNDFALARYSSDGSLDETFGSGGKVRTDFFTGDDMVTSIAIQSDGRIVVAGYALTNGVSDFALARYVDDGSLDNSFNGNGKVTLDIDSGNDVALGIQLQPEGKIVAAGQVNIRSATEFGLVRFNADGTLDEEFSGQGKTRLSFGMPGEAWGLILLPDGFALLVGNAGDGKSSDFAIARFAL